MLGAGEAPEHAAPRRGPGAEPEHVLVGLEGLVHVLALLGEGGRIHDDPVPALRLQGPHELEGVALHADVPVGFQAVHGPVPFRLVQGGGGDVQGRHLGGAAQARMDGKAARVAEGVQHAAALGDAAQGQAMLPLVQEEPRLLAFQEVHGEAGGPLADGDGSGQAALEEAVHDQQVLLLPPGLAALHEDGDALGLGLDQELGPPGLAQGFEPGRAHLQHQGVGVAVHHEARQEIPLPEDPAAARLRAIQTQGPAQLEGLPETIAEERLVQGGVLEAEDPHRQRIRPRGRAHRQDVAGVVREADQGRGRGLGKGARVDPGVLLREQDVLAGLEAQEGIGPAGGIHEVHDDANGRVIHASGCASEPAGSPPRRIPGFRAGGSRG